MNEEITPVLIAIARVEEKIDAMNMVQIKHLEMDKEIHMDHEKRIRNLEASKWRAQGTATCTVYGA